MEKDRKREREKTGSHSLLARSLCLSTPTTGLLWKRLSQRWSGHFIFGSHHQCCLFNNKIITRHPGFSLIPRIYFRSGLFEVTQKNSEQNVAKFDWSSFCNKLIHYKWSPALISGFTLITKYHTAKCKTCMKVLPGKILSNVDLSVWASLFVTTLWVSSWISYLKT